MIVIHPTAAVASRVFTEGTVDHCRRSVSVVHPASLAQIVVWILAIGIAAGDGEAVQDSIRTFTVIAGFYGGHNMIAVVGATWV